MVPRVPRVPRQGVTSLGPSAGGTYVASLNEPTDGTHLVAAHVTELYPRFVGRPWGFDMWDFPLTQILVPTSATLLVVAGGQDDLFDFNSAGRW